MSTTGVGSPIDPSPISLHPSSDDNSSIPPSASSQSTVSMGGDWIYRLERNAGMKETMLGKMVRDMESTFRVVGRALQVSGQASLEKITKEKHIFKLSAVVAALLGNIIYGTSLLTLTVIKTVVWVPMISVTAIVGGAGAVLLHALEGADQRSLAQGSLEFFGYAAAGIGELMGVVAFVPSAILMGIGYVGAGFIEANVFGSYSEPYTQVDAKLLRALQQANTSNIPVRHSFIPEGLENENVDTLRTYFQWMDELGVDFNETRIFNDQQTPLLCIHESYVENSPSTIWGKQRLLVIQAALKKAGVWDKLHPETQKQIDRYIARKPRSTGS